MKKKLILKNLYVSILLIVILLLTACKKEVFDVTGDSNPKVYFSTSQQTIYINNYNFSVKHTPVSSIGTVYASFPVRCTQKPNGSINVKCDIDNSQIDAYNARNKTSYVPVPDGLVVISSNELTIISGEFSSSDSLNLSISGENLSQLTETGYLIPIKISSLTNSGNAEISTNLNTVFVIVTTYQSNCYDSPVITDMTGTLITPRTAWTATIDATLFSGTLPQMFDGNTNTYWRLQPPAKFVLSVNLASQYVGITGIRTHSNSTSYGITTAKVYTSIDGISWSSQGTATLSTVSSYQYIKFYSAITAKYLKLEVIGWRSTSSVRWGEFDVYKN